MHWEDEFAWGNNKGEHTLSSIPPVVYTPFKCKVCNYEYHPDSSYSYSVGNDKDGNPIIIECTSTEYKI
jgi:hypothetical protein|tara:strand:+ start:158 stop:364 length:207 start_codon:yes stop_codon:yes gene_type:complete